MPITKQTLVLIAGWGADKRTWSTLEKALSNRFDFTYVDLPFSEGRELNSLDQELDALAVQIPAASIVLAWSLGGMMATQIAVKIPSKVKSLILLATNPCFVAVDHWPDAMPETVFNSFCEGFKCSPEKTQKRFNTLQVDGNPERKKLLAVLNEQSALSPANRKISEDLLAFLADIDNSKNIFNIDVPVLCFFGERDALVPISSAEAILQLCDTAATLVQVEKIPDCGHVPHISHSDILAKKIVAFLESSAGVNADAITFNHARYKKDKRRIANSFSKASSTYDMFAHLQLNVAQSLCKWAPDVSGRVLDIGCGTGYCLDEIKKKEGVSALCGFDISIDMLRTAKNKCDTAPNVLQWCSGDIERLPFSPNSFDWVVSSLAVQWCENLHAVFSGVAELLSPRGHFLLSSLGPDTLNELNMAWQSADPAHVHVNEFVDCDIVLSAAIAAGFEVDVYAVDFQTLHYDNVTDLMRALKGIGAHNMNAGSNPGLTGKSTLMNLTNAYEPLRMSNGKLPATYHIYYWLFTKRKEL